MAEKKDEEQLLTKSAERFMRELDGKYARAGELAKDIFADGMETIMNELRNRVKAEHQMAKAEGSSKEEGLKRVLEIIEEYGS